MSKARSPIVTRKRLLITALLLVFLVCAGWYFGRFPLARWAIDKSLAAAHLQPATYQLDSVSLSAIQLSKLTIGTTPWLQVSNVDVTFTLRNLLKSRVNTIQLTDAQWNLQSVNGEMNLGYVPAATTTPTPISLPCDLIEIKSSVIRAEVDTTRYDIAVSGTITPSVAGALEAKLAVSAFERTTTVVAQIRSDSSTFDITIDGDIPSLTVSPVPAAPAKWHTTMKRNRLTSATSIEFNSDIQSITHRFNTLDLTGSAVKITADATLDSRGLSALNTRFVSDQLTIGDYTLNSVNLHASRLSDTQFSLNLITASDHFDIPSLRGTLTHSPDPSAPDATLFDIALNAQTPITIETSSAITATLPTVSVTGRARKDGAGMKLQSGQLSLNDGSMQAGDFALTDIRGVANMNSPDEIEISNLAAIIDDGGTISIDPFTWNPAAPRIHTRANLSNLDLEHWLPILSSKHASGEGRVSGNVDFALDWSSGKARLGDLTGRLYADPSHGYIQVADADAVGELLDKQDPRFATDELMRPIRDKIVEALRDFSYKTLTVALTRKGDRTVALTYLSGYGRHGKDPQGLNLTLDLHVQDAVLDLASRIAAKSEVTKAARNALEDFFKQPAPETK